MAVKVITDSTADLSPELAQELGIGVVPIYVRFGNDVYRDGVDLGSDDFFEKLTTTAAHPATSQPTPADFSGIYSKHSKNTDGIISIHISSKISGTYNSALLAKAMFEPACPIEVVDSMFNSGGLALVVLAAARLARRGKSLPEVLEETHKAIRQIEMLGMFDTMKYLARSGRVNRAIAATGNILNVKPLLTFRDGEIVRAGMVRAVSRGMDELYNFVSSRENIRELVIVHSTAPERADALRTRLGPIFPAKKTIVLKMGAALGANGGPGVILVALRAGE
ncbi:MAG: DegV family protein [Dehalococcoidales bacterium]|nr:MAG: DegV family protein [Dehalococcoidales bacterium]